MTKTVITPAAMTEENAIISILSRWPSRKAVAEDAGVLLIVVHRWHQRQSIPSAYDARLIEGAARRGLPLSAQELANARAPREQTGHSDGAGQIRSAALVNSDPTTPAREDAA